MEIYNLHSSGPRLAQDFKVVTHEEYGRNGKVRKNRYVEYTIIGKNRQWTDFMTIRDFKRLNPTVSLKTLK